MNSYERRIIHNTLSNSKDVYTDYASNIKYSDETIIFNCVNKNNKDILF